MTTYWRPLPAKAIKVGLRTVVINERTYAQGARCDLCQWSGLLREFDEFTRAGDTMQVCYTCGNNNQVLADLISDGWDLAEKLPF